MLSRYTMTVAFSLLLCTTAFPQAATQDGSKIPVRKDRPPGCDPVVSVAPKLLGTSLLQVFDTANFQTRRAILTMVPRLASREERQALILKGLRQGGNRAGIFIASLAALTAIQLGEEGDAILRFAVSSRMVRDDRARALVVAHVSR